MSSNFVFVVSSTAPRRCTVLKSLGNSAAPKTDSGPTRVGQEVRVDEWCAILLEMGQEAPSGWNIKTTEPLPCGSVVLPTPKGKVAAIPSDQDVGLTRPSLLLRNELGVFGCLVLSMSQVDAFGATETAGRLVFDDDGPMSDVGESEPTTFFCEACVRADTGPTELEAPGKRAPAPPQALVEGWPRSALRRLQPAP